MELGWESALQYCLQVLALPNPDVAFVIYETDYPL
jgi:hypothetical protein